jgi:hypothetical protein
VLTKQVLGRRRTLVLVAITVALISLIRVALALALPSPTDHGDPILAEIRSAALGLSLLVLLLDASRGGALWRAVGRLELAFVVFLSALYLQLFCVLVFGVPELLRAGGSVTWNGQLLVEILWLGSLGAILTLARLEARALAVAFVLLAWWMPVLGAPEAVDRIFSTKPRTHSTWSADGILPMLIPQLLALGFVCLERWRR